MPKEIRPIRIEGDIAYVPLTKGKVAIIDASDAAEVGKYNWSSSNNYAVSHINDKYTFLHLFIMNPPSDMEVHFVNKDRSNCCRLNMRMSKIIRPIRIEGDIAYVTLTQGKVAIIDACEAEEVGKYNWCYDAYGYAMAHIKGKTIHLHAFIMKPPFGMEVDHVDRKRLCCLRGNMRLCTPAQNKRNSGKRWHNKSGIKGVSWDTSRQKWVASICIDCKRMNLGGYQDINDAAQAYREAALKYHAEFACTGEE